MASNFILNRILFMSMLEQFFKEMLNILAQWVKFIFSPAIFVVKNILNGFEFKSILQKNCPELFVEVKEKPFIFFIYLFWGADEYSPQNTSESARVIRAVSNIQDMYLTTKKSLENKFPELSKSIWAKKCLALVCLEAPHFVLEERRIMTAAMILLYEKGESQKSFGMLQFADLLLARKIILQYSTPKPQSEENLDEEYSLRIPQQSSSTATSSVNI